jgi:uncharacterized protein (DUF1697 family)
VAGGKRWVVLLRGINVGAHNRIAMAELKRLLEAAGMDEVRTYLQSGNVVLSSGLPAAKLAARCRRTIADGAGLDIGVIVRSRAELAAVVKRNPLADVAVEPKRYQVSFFEKKPDSSKVRELEALASGGERLVAIGREVYAWHPGGVARSRLWARLAARDLGGTARNWSTVRKLLEMAGS